MALLSRKKSWANKVTCTVKSTSWFETLPQTNCWTLTNEGFSNMNLLFQGSIFRCHDNFRGFISFQVTKMEAPLFQ